MKTVWESDSIRLVYAVDELPRNENYPYSHDRFWSFKRVDDRKVNKVIYHQKAGGYAKGFTGLRRTASFFVRTPKYRNGKWLGNGRGWPGYAYTIDVPYEPEIVDGRYIIYQCQDFDIVSSHTKGGNTHGVGVSFQGLFRSRHNKRFVPSKGTTGQPSDAQMLVARDLWEEFLKPKFGLTNQDLQGHFDYTKATCPGDALESIILDYRQSQAPKEPDQDLGAPVFDEFPLDSWELRQAALVALEFDLGQYGPLNNGVDGMAGELTRFAIEQIESGVNAEPDGLWDEAVEEAVGLLLELRNISMNDLVALAP